MTFDTRELGPVTSRPVELFKFVGNYATWRYTSWGEDVTNTDGTYTAIPIKRSKVEQGSQEDDNISMDIELPYTNEMVSAYAFSDAPPQLDFELYRAHPEDYNDTLLLWTGKTLSWSIKGRIAKLRVPSLFNYLLGSLCPAPKYQAPCNHVLYDSRCSVDPTSYEHTTTVSSVSGLVVTLTTQPFANDLMPAGEVEFTTGGERRMISTVSGTAVTVTSRFANLQVGDTVTIRQGCDHSFTTCKSKFNNGINFGGFPLIPGKNPFTADSL